MHETSWCTFLVGARVARQKQARQWLRVLRQDTGLREGERVGIVSVRYSVRREGQSVCPYTCTLLL